jgi:hypothetical protein
MSFLDKKPGFLSFLKSTKYKLDKIEANGYNIMYYNINQNSLSQNFPVQNEFPNYKYEESNNFVIKQELFNKNKNKNSNADFFKQFTTPEIVPTIIKEDEKKPFIKHLPSFKSIQILRHKKIL